MILNIVIYIVLIVTVNYRIFYTYWLLSISKLQQHKVTKYKINKNKFWILFLHNWYKVFNKITWIVIEARFFTNYDPTMMLLMGMWINLTKNPMNPMIAKPMAVATAIFWNSEISTRNWDIIQFSLWDFRIITRK